MKKDAELPDLEQAASVANHSFITSGGGFSSIWPRVSFQEKAVSTYLHNTPPGYASHLYNASGRAFPDVSAIADAFQVFIEGKKTVVGGTSGSAPIVASMITLINENRLAAGKRPVGFLNPTFYANPGAFKDVSFTLALFCCEKCFLTSSCRLPQVVILDVARMVLRRPLDGTL